MLLIVSHDGGRLSSDSGLVLIDELMDASRKRQTLLGGIVMAQDTWLPTLITETPEEGYELAVVLARKAVGMTQPDPAVREKLRPVYANNPDSLTLASQVVAIHFQTVAAANNYWQYFT